MLEYMEKHEKQSVYLLSGERRKKKDHFMPADGYNSLLCKCTVWKVE